jgi:hypothetical protein
LCRRSNYLKGPLVAADPEVATQSTLYPAIRKIIRPKSPVATINIFFVVKLVYLISMIF